MVSFKLIENVCADFALSVRYLRKAIRFRATGLRRCTQIIRSSPNSVPIFRLSLDKRGKLWYPNHISLCYERRQIPMLQIKHSILPLLLAFLLLLGACGTKPEAPAGVESFVSAEPPAQTGSGDPNGSSGGNGITLPPDESILYVTCTEEDLHRGDLILVNQAAPYDASLHEGELTDVRTSRVTEIQEEHYGLSIERSLLQTLEALQTGLQDDRKDRVCLLINDSYRSAEEQQAIIDEYLELYGQAYVDKYVAPVGYSEHHTGLAVDLSFYDLATGRILATTSAEAAAHYAWLLENCSRYGLILRYPPGKEAILGTSETWHFRYVGFPHAGYIFSHDLVLEEYMDLLRETSFDRPLSIRDGGEQYRVYYVPAAGGETQVPVPQDKPYTLSGNNADGFIVTVRENG